MKERVEMRPAYEWTCDHCGQNNFASCIVAEMSEDDRVAMNVVSDSYDVELVTYPDSVMCPHCRELYDTVDRDEE
jgi:hypothetical protein